MKVLFVARTYPPTVGGMQRFCSDFYNNYKKVGDIDLVANTGGNIAFPLFILRVIIHLMMHAGKYDIIHFSDAVMAPLSFFARLFSKSRVTFTVHGLDIIYPKYGYQKLIIPFLRKADRIFAVSKYTLDQCVARGVDPKIMAVIPNCINFEYFDANTGLDRSAVIEKYRITPEGKKVLITVGRLIKRKGHAWFIANVFEQLPENFIYIIAGAGPEFENIKKQIEVLGLSNRVHLLGQVTEDEKKVLYKLSDIFIMPNISVPGDQEGFGIVILEAGGFDLPVVAANLEGIQDAVIEGETGFLVEEADVRSYVERITQISRSRMTVKDVVIRNFDCNQIAQKYQKEFHETLKTQ